MSTFDRGIPSLIEPATHAHSACHRSVDRRYEYIHPFMLSWTTP